MKLNSSVKIRCAKAFHAFLSSRQSLSTVPLVNPVPESINCEFMSVDQHTVVLKGNYWKKNDPHIQRVGQGLAQIHIKTGFPISTVYGLFNNFKERQ